MSTLAETVVAGLVSRDTGSPIPLLGSRATGEIAGRGARVTIAQRFCNDGKQPLESVYKFPLPEAAAVCGFRARVGDRKIEGTVEEREEAFRLYDEAMEKGDGAYLLDQERPNIFTLSVGNLNPGQEAVVEIDYAVLLPAHGGETRFCLPTTISPRYLPADAPDEDGIKATDRIHPEYASEVPYGLSLSLRVLGAEGIESVESPSHRIRQTFGPGLIQVEFSSDEVKMDRDFVLNVVRREGFENRGFAVEKGEDLFVQVDLCPRDPEEAAAWDQEIVFLLDCSGSMDGDSIDEARKALTAALGRLEPGSRFNLYRFGSRFENLFKESVPYNQKNLDFARRWVSSVEADMGGTELLAPLREICRRKKEGRAVLLITDGQVGNESEILDLLREHAPGTRFFTIGIGFGPNEHMLRSAARIGDGACEMIAPGERIEHKTLRLFGKVMGTTVQDVKIIGGNHIVQAPARMVLFTGETSSIFARMPAKDGRGLRNVKLLGRMHGKEIAWEVPVSILPGEMSAVPLLWAREAVRDIEEGNASALVGGSRQGRRKEGKARDAAVSLSKEFGIASFAASFVAVEKRDEKDKTTGEAILKKVPVMITKGWHGRERGFVSAPQMMSPLSMRTFGLSRPGRRLASRSVPMLAEPDSDPADRVRRKIGGATKGGRKASRATEGSPSTQPGVDRTSLLMDVLACQRAEGGFALDAKGSRAVGVSLKKIREAAGKASVPEDVDAFVLVCTVLVFAYLEGRAGDLKGTWGPVAEKSRKWIAKITKSFEPRIGNEPISKWAAAALPTA